VQKLCGAGRVDGVIQFSGTWAIPENTPKPTRTAVSKPWVKKSTAAVKEDGSNG